MAAQSTTSAPTTSAPTAPTVRLVVTSPGPAYGRAFVLRHNGRDRYIGSSSRADVCLEDPSVSHLHARLRWHGTELVVRDLGTRYGTQLNGARFSGARYLRDHDDLRLGDIEVRVEAAVVATSS